MTYLYFIRTMEIDTYVLSDTVIARKHAASQAFRAALGGRGAGAELELPDGSAPGPREVFLV